MFYRMSYDMETSDKLERKGEGYIWAYESNTNEIEYPNIKKGWFHTIPIVDMQIDEWPEVIFYYNSEESDRQEDYLCNVDDWPIVHQRVKEALEQNGIQNVLYLPIVLVDIITKKRVNEYYLMYITSFIKAYDMKKSQYRYLEKYDCYDFDPMETYLDLGVCNDKDIFRCVYNEAAIFVSEKFYRLIREKQFSGFDFTHQA